MSDDTFFPGEELELITREGDASVMAGMVSDSILSVESDNGETVNLQLLDKDRQVIGAACFPKNRLRRKLGFVN
jgi:hypothetical protein